MNETIKLEKVSLTFPTSAGSIEVLKSVSFHACKYETVAIVGPSGSGKSSLIAVASGLERMTSGEVHLLGTSLSGMNEDSLARLRRNRVSLVFQSFHLIPTMTALDNIRTVLEISKSDNIDDRAKTILGAVGLSDRLSNYPGQLSGGECQRVAVARALVTEPDIIFADEPTGNLDTVTGQHVADLLFSIAKDQGTTLIVATHDAGLAQRADRIVTMDSGHIL